MLSLLDMMWINTDSVAGDIIIGRFVNPLLQLRETESKLKSMSEKLIFDKGAMYVCTYGGA